MAFLIIFRTYKFFGKDDKFLLLNFRFVFLRMGAKDFNFPE